MRRVLGARTAAALLVTAGAWALAVGLLAGCGKKEATRPEDGGPPPVDATTAALTDSGWVHFEAGDYAGAITFFTSALGITGDYTDAFSGRGWAHLRQDSLSLAESDFASAMQYADYWRNNEATTGALVGTALTASLGGNYAAAAAAGASASALGGEFYTFAHDPSITVNHVRLLVAESYVRLGRYQEAYLQLVEIDVTAIERIDPSSGLFLQQLLEELAAISQRL